MKHSFTRSGYGIISLCMLFFVVIILMLSILSYTEAKSKQRTSQRYEQHVKEYYQADQKAMILMHQLQYIQREDTVERNAFLDANNIVYDTTKQIAAYTVPINDDLELQVTVRIQEDELFVETWVVKGR